MQRIRWISVLAMLAIIAGCGKSSQTPQSGEQSSAAEKNSAEQEATNAEDAEKSDRSVSQQQALGETPTKAVHEFLEALRTGDDKKAEQLLTKKAYEKTGEIGLRVSPEGSPSARFEVGKVDYVDQGARVLSTWTDIHPQGHEQTDRFIWILRKEPEGWRIAGMAAEIFPGEPPLVLNFEDPEEMNRRKRLAEEEIRRRQNQRHSQRAKDSNQSGRSIRR